MTRWNFNSKYISLSKILRALCFICSVTFLLYLYFSERTLTWTPPKAPEHTLCVLVPLRNAHDELFEFIPFMNGFLRRQSIAFHFVVVNHVADGHRFNKGTLFNVGFKMILKHYPACDYLALHDVDILPLNDELSYGYPRDVVFHVAPGALRPVSRERNSGNGSEERGRDSGNYIGGIAIINHEQYIRCNGFGNHFWGWGGEDKNFVNRMRYNNIRRTKPYNLTTNRSNTFKNIHSQTRLRDRKRCRDQLKIGDDFIVNDLESGLSDVKYELTSEHSVAIDGVSFSFYSISVPCDYSKTPWCKIDCSNDWLPRITR